jgi:hypothetical protein
MLYFLSFACATLGFCCMWASIVAAFALRGGNPFDPGTPSIGNAVADLLLLFVGCACWIVAWRLTMSLRFKSVMVAYFGLLVTLVTLWQIWNIGYQMADGDFPWTAVLHYLSLPFLGLGSRDVYRRWTAGLHA